MAICHCIRTELPIIKEFCTTYSQELQTVTDHNVIDEKFIDTITRALQYKSSSTDEQGFSEHLSQALNACFKALDSVKINESTVEIGGITYDVESALSAVNQL